MPFQDFNYYMHFSRKLQYFLYWPVKEWKILLETSVRWQFPVFHSTPCLIWTQLQWRAVIKSLSALPLDPPSNSDLMDKNKWMQNNPALSYFWALSASFFTNRMPKLVKTFQDCMLQWIWFTRIFSIFSKKFEFWVQNFRHKLVMLLIHKLYAQISWKFTKIDVTMLYNLPEVFKKNLKSLNFEFKFWTWI
jgi:hypothetical protein